VFHLNPKVGSYMDYYLFMAVMMVLTSERVEKHPGVTHTTFPPPIFIETASVSVFCVSPPPPITNDQGGYIYKCF
jgi:hypothetical protein